MADAPVQQPNQLVDPLFNIPDGVVDLIYIDKASAATLEGVDGGGPGGALGYAADYVQGEDLGYPADALDSPAILDIASQTLRRSPGGKDVVDVVFDIEEVAFNARYELRVTKT